MNIKDYILILQIKENNYLALEEFLFRHKKIIDICIYQFHLERDLILDKIFEIMSLDCYKLKKINNLDYYIFSCLKNFKYSLNQQQKKEWEKLYILYQKHDFIDSKENTNLYFNSLLKLVDKDSAELLKLRHFNCFTLRQIAQIKNISKSKVDYKIKKAYKKIYDILNEEII